MLLSLLLEELKNTGIDFLLTVVYLEQHTNDG